ncbi:MAG TPA: undecaprenyl-diphosphatase [Gemmatimonadaceae bacterium]|jgi:undecaprenyl-diphosphatase|nr:undecaprenyl-diphosphatase [Gemmatimonadaceae bacterium]
MIGLAAPIADSSSSSLDYTLFRAVNGVAGRSAALDSVMIASAKYLPIVFALALVVLWLSWRPRNQRGALLAGVSALIALGLGQLIGKALPRPRPYLSHTVNQLIPPSLDTSFPSDHAILGFAVAVMIWKYNRRAGVALLVLAMLMAIARVFVGAHYPGDVLGGAVLGTLTSLGLAALSERPPMARALATIFRILRRLRLAAPPIG